MFNLFLVRPNHAWINFYGYNQALAFWHLQKDTCRRVCPYRFCKLHIGFANKVQNVRPHRQSPDYFRRPNVKCRQLASPFTGLVIGQEFVVRMRGAVNVINVADHYFKWDEKSYLAGGPGTGFSFADFTYSMICSMEIINSGQGTS